MPVTRLGKGKLRRRDPQSSPHGPPLQPAPTLRFASCACWPTSRRHARAAVTVRAVSRNGLTHAVMRWRGGRSCRLMHGNSRSSSSSGAPAPTPPVVDSEATSPHTCHTSRLTASRQTAHSPAQASGRACAADVHTRGLPHARILGAGAHTPRHAARRESARARGFGVACVSTASPAV